VNQIFQKVDADIAVSVTDLKRNAATVLDAARHQAVAVLNHSRVVGYVISPEVWEHVQELYDDAKIVERLQSEGPQQGIPVNIDEL
jgi:antitoxin StbD